MLKELPKSLDDTYERMLKEIGKVNPRQAHRLLQCLTVATRPLLVEELAEVLALEFDGAKDGIPALNKDWRWDDHKQGVLSTCSSLISIVDQADGFAVRDFDQFSLRVWIGGHARMLQQLRACWRYSPALSANLFLRIRLGRRHLWFLEPQARCEARSWSPRQHRGVGMGDGCLRQK